MTPVVPPSPQDDDSSLALALDPKLIVETIAGLQRRVEERFPESSLGDLCAKLLTIGSRTERRLNLLGRANVWLRVAAVLAVVLIAGAVVATMRAVLVSSPEEAGGAFGLLQAIDSGIQDVVFVGIGLAFLLTIEVRVKRRHALGFIRELRAVAHIVDMHQLTKDPDRLLWPTPDTPSSPIRTMSRVELMRYLDYCSEILSLTSKIAALYAERMIDAVVLQAVDEIETLTNGLSNKIWQKVIVLGGGLAEEDDSAPESPGVVDRRQATRRHRYAVVGVAMSDARSG